MAHSEVRITGELLARVLTTGHTMPAVRVLRGLPEGAKCVEAYMDDGDVVLLFRLETDDPAPVARRLDVWFQEVRP